MNALPTAPLSIQDFAQRMVRCNLQNSLQPLGDERLTQDQSIQKFAMIVLKDWLPRFQDKGDQKRVAQLCAQIKKYFTDVTVQNKVNAITSQITVTCNSARCEVPAPWMKAPIQAVGLDRPPAERFEALMKELLWPPRTKEGQIELCQWLMSVFVYECERMHSHLKVHLMQHEMERQRNESLDENTQIKDSTGGMIISFDFPSDNVKSFDEVCFWLNYRRIEEGSKAIQELLLEAVKSQDKFQLSSCIQRINQEMDRVRAAVAALSGGNGTLQRMGEKFLCILGGKLFEAAIGCLKHSKVNQPIVCGQKPKNFDTNALLKRGAQLLHLFKERELSSNELVNIYFSHFNAAKALYDHVREKRDSLLGGRSAVLFNLSRFQNTELATLPDTLKVDSSITQANAVLIRDALLEPYLRAPELEKPVVIPAPQKPKKKPPKSKPSIDQSMARKPLTTEEKMRIEAEETDPLSEKKETVFPNVWGALPPLPMAASRSPAAPVQLQYDYRVERWLADELNPADFPEYDGNPTPKVISYHAFPVEVDDYLGDALKQTWENTTTGHLDDQYVIPAEIELPGSEPVRGVISYAIGKDGICYHRYFHEMDTRTMVEKFGMRRFEKADFPELAAGDAAPSRGIKPKKGRVVKEIPALGVVAFHDERTGAIVRIFRG